uniref:Pectinesterase n=1 Tax=Cunninghamia lanceolata TaxID=28977 RepID=A0A6G9W2N8_CUNLA|nr:pectin methylesterase 8 [Cunninghamia lanceolata]
MGSVSKALHIFFNRVGDFSSAILFMMYGKVEGTENRRIVIIMAAAMIMVVVAVVMCVAVGVAPANSLHPRIVVRSSAKKTLSSHHFGRTACKGAADPQLCVSTIAKLPGWPVAPPSELVNIAVKASIGLVERTSAVALSLNGSASAGLEQSALQDCIELLDDTADQLTEALEDVVGMEFDGVNFVANDVRTLLSAGLTNQDTCIEGMSNTNGLVRSQLENSVQQISDLVRTSLAMAKRISDLTDIIDDFKPPFHNRRLMADADDEDFPAWLSAADRKLLQTPTSDLQVDAWVAQDGSGNYTTITDAINAAPEKSSRRFVIHVKAGIYHERIEIKKKKANLTLLGDGMDSTIITGNRSVFDKTTTYRSATFAVKGAEFIARDIGFENTAGPYRHQAVALRVDSDQSVFYRCSVTGYQDTLYAHSLRQFYRECKIYGTVDFIFGNAAAVFQSCLILARKPLADQMITVTAQSRKDPNQNTGFSIHDCNITAAPDYAAVKTSFRTFLGRPWKMYSRTVFMQSFLDDIVQPQGWVPWNTSNFALDTLYYGEFMNYGPGAGLVARINWLGYHILNISEATTFTVAQFIDGNKWLPSTGITYLSGLKV